MSLGEPWKRSAVLMIGGLTELGFVPATALVMIVSHQGRGLLDCLSGEIVARDLDETTAHWFDSTRPAVRGIGEASDHWIPVSGLAGGSGIEATDWWHARRDGLDQVTLSGTDEDQLIVDPSSGIRAFSFSDNGQFFVVGTPSDITIYTRPDPQPQPGL